MSENPGTEKVKALLKKVDDGSFAIPYFQRGFEWTPGMVCDLIESILQDYFAGLLLFWELDQEQAKKEEWDPVWGAKGKKTPTVAILDGQQRLASLYYSINNPAKLFPKRNSFYVFYIDVTKVLNDDKDESISYKYFTTHHQPWDRLIRDKDVWARTGIVPLAVLSAKDPTNSNQDYLDSVEFAIWLDNYIELNKEKLPTGTTSLKVYQVFSSILNYSFVYYPLSSDRDLHDICNIFARVNSKGMKLSTFDLMNAFLYPKDIKLRKDLWDNFDNDILKNIDSGMNEYLLKVISLHKQNYCSAKYLFNLIPGQETTRKDENRQKYQQILVQDSSEFKKLWQNSCNYSEKARKLIMNTGFSDFGAIKRDYVPNSTIIPVLAAILWEFDGDVDDIEFSENLQKWYWSAIFTEDYSGSSDTVMAKDFRDWKEWLESHKTIERINRVTLDYVENIDFKTTKKGSARYNAILCMLALNDAKDFHKGQIVGSAEYSHESINDHHIFPSGVKGLDSSKSKTFSNYKDSIANRTLLLDETNNKISSSSPSEYISKMIKKHGDESKVKSLLQEHFISDNAYEYLRQDDFDNFVIEREKEIREHLKEKLSLQ